MAWLSPSARSVDLNALAMAEECRLRQLARQRRAIDSDLRAAPPAPGVGEPRKPSLPVPVSPMRRAGGEARAAASASSRAARKAGARLTSGGSTGGERAGGPASRRLKKA